MRRIVFESRASKLKRNIASRQSFVRSFRSSRQAMAAHEFSMPAMSPTMTEGNISEWKIKEGESFTAGDVLMEIETDKAQMEVEAQDDGVMAKIIERAGARGVKVGTRIAITADPNDDIGRLDVSDFESASSETESVSDGGQHMSGDGQGSPAGISHRDVKMDVLNPRNKSYPLFPSVLQLLHERGITDDEISKMTHTGPNGRLLKGDVLAYLGKIDAEYPVQQSKRLRTLSHLDLGNVEIQSPALESKAVESISKKSELLPPPVVREFSMPVPLATLEAFRQRMCNVLGIDVPLEELINRATSSCNRDLPLSNREKTSSEGLFNAILGLKTSATGSKSVGNFRPQMHQYRMASPTAGSSKNGTTHRTDVIDELIMPMSCTRSPSVPSAPSLISPETNTRFSVTVPSGEEHRAKLFLQRFKTALQSNPGNLLF